MSRIGKRQGARKTTAPRAATEAPEAVKGPPAWENSAVGRDATGKPRRWEAGFICALLTLLVFAVFGQTLWHGFINFDDDQYVYGNPRVLDGLSWKNLAWAFTHVHSNNWHPLTTLSHMLDCQLFGLNPAGPHAVNVLLHAAVAVLLFWVLQAMTGYLWRSAFVAAVFAIHPLRVESVAWVSERKDVLSGLFFMLTLWAYLHYSRRPRPVRYALVVLLFVLGLMSKPMLVTLPLILLLLDYWPLRRDDSSPDGTQAWKKLALEKLPLAALAAASCVATTIAQRQALKSFETIPILQRLGNSAVACATYIGQMFWPVDLAIFYLFERIVPWKVILSLTLLAGLTAAVICLRRTRPYLWTGWWWYLIMLAPVIGIVQVGGQARADRYTYLPQIGLALALTWWVAEFRPESPRLRVFKKSLATTALIALALAAFAQVSFWKDSETLWSHALSCTASSAVAHSNLGAALEEKGDIDEAIEQYRKAAQIDPRYFETYGNLGNALAKKGRLVEAIEQYQQALLLKPDIADLHTRLGISLFQNGREGEAISHLQTALRISPNSAAAHNNLGNALLRNRQLDEAIENLRQAVRLKPDFATAQLNLSNALFLKGRFDEAISHYEQALRLEPDNAESHHNLGSALVQKGQLAEAMEHYRKALKIQPSYTLAYIDLGTTLARTGQVNEAIEQFESALRLEPDRVAARYYLGMFLETAGRQEEALAQYRRILQLQPDHADALNNLAWGLATTPEASLRNGAEAVEHARKANELTGSKNPSFLDTLAAAYAEAGRFPEAVSTARQALELAKEQSNSALVEALQHEIALYQAGQPLRARP